MPTRIHKLITPLIILPLFTGGLVSFVAFSQPGTDITEIISNTKPALLEIATLRSGASIFKIILAAFAPSILALGLLFALYFLFISDALHIMMRVADSLRNRSPPIYA